LRNGFSLRTSLGTLSLLLRTITCILDKEKNEDWRARETR
jgi:hypothetical protein